MAKKLSNQAKVQFHMMADPGWLERIAAWRRTQPDLPNASEAVRRLVDMALDAAEKKKTRR